MANDKNTERNINSAKCLLALFKEVQAETLGFIDNPGLLDQLSSQIKMGHIDVPTRSIFRSSMSTLKRAANTSIEGGFKELDHQRKLAYAALSKALRAGQASQESKEGQRVEAKNFKEVIQVLRQEVFLRDGVVYKLFRLLNQSAKENPSETRRQYFTKSASEELARLGFKGSNINEK